MKQLKPLVTTLGLTTALFAPALAQKATPEQMGTLGEKAEYGTLHLKTGLGSFKIKPTDPLGKAEGRVEIAFSGSILVSQLDGNIQVSDGLVKEFDDLGRQIYHGTGSAVVSGRWRGLQWFGRNLTATWYGKGLIQMIGEFDKDLKTGEYWYDDPDIKGQWPSTMWTMLLPEQKVGVTPGVVPTKRGEGN